MNINEFKKRLADGQTDFSGVKFDSGIDLHGEDLSGIDLSGADFWRADLTEAKLTGADLSGVNFHGADLTGTTLTGADLTEANLSEANLSGADFSSADLSGTNFHGADLTGATLADADLWRANLSGARGICAIYVDGASSRDDTLYAVQHDTCTMIKAECFWGTLGKFEQRVSEEKDEDALYIPIIALLRAWETRNQVR